MHPLHCPGGQTRLLYIAYSLARGNETHGVLQCYSHKNIWLGPGCSIGTIIWPQIDTSKHEDFTRALKLSTEVSET